MSFSVCRFVVRVFCDLLDGQQQLLGGLVFSSSVMAALRQADGVTAADLVWCAAQQGATDDLRTLLQWLAACKGDVAGAASRAMWVASCNDHAETVRVLLEAGAHASHECHELVALADDSDPGQNREVVKCSALWIATHKGSSGAALALVQAKALLELAGGPGWQTPVYVAARNGDCDSLQSLLLAKANVNAIDNMRRSPAWVAACQGDTRVLRILVNANADVDWADIDGRTPAVAAASSGSVDALLVLVSARADLDVETGFALATAYPLTPGLPETALSLAAERGDHAVVSVLVQGKADLHKGKPARLAASHGHDNVLQSLVAAKVDALDAPLLDAAWAGHDSAIQVLVRAKANLNPAAGVDRRQLWRAATHSGRHACVMTLMRAKADVSRDEIYAIGLATLREAARAGYLDDVQNLLSARVDVDANYNDVQPFHETLLLQCHSPLGSAVEGRHLDVVRALLKAHALVNDVPSHRGGGFLKMAAAAGMTEIVVALLQAKAEVDTLDYDNPASDGATPLWVAVDGLKVETVRVLLQARAAVDKASTRGQGKTPLLCAIAHPNSHTGTDLACTLLQSKADPSRRALYHPWASPLEHAVKFRNLQVALALLQAKASANSVDAAHASTSTPLQMAIASGYSAMVTLLRELAPAATGNVATAIAAVATKGGDAKRARQLNKKGGEK